LTSIGRKNIDNLARYAPTIEVVPNMAERAKLNKLGLEMVGDISWPEHVAIFTAPFKMAVQLGIPLIMYGENPQDQYGGPVGSDQARQLTQRWRSEFGGFLGLRPSDISGLDMRPYTMPTDGEISLNRVEAHFLGSYIPWDSHHNAKVAMDAGMQTLGRPPGPQNWWEFENLDCGITGIHCYFMHLKYGYTRADAQLSVDIRSGRISRDDALAQSKNRTGFPEYYAGVNVFDVLDRIGMTRTKLEKLMEKFSSSRTESSQAC